MIFTDPQLDFAMILTDSGHVAFIDRDDAALVDGRDWQLSAGGYVRAGGKFLHRVILGHPDSDIDHANGDKLDNRRCNLRLCTMSQNQANRATKPHSSKYRGVTFVRKTSRWRTQIMVNQKYESVGYFATEEEAARAYDRAALEHFGEFARLNFPIETKSRAKAGAGR